MAPTALALRGNDLLIVDSAAGRVWRADLGLNTLTPIAGAPATPATAVAIGPDLSAWVLDGLTRQVLRFARDGRLMQTWRGGSVSPSPVAMALADGGTTLLVADDSLRQWIEVRPAGAFATPMPQDDSVRGVDGLAVGGDSVFVLDRKRRRGARGAPRRPAARPARRGRAEAAGGDRRRPLLARLRARRAGPRRQAARRGPAGAGVRCGGAARAADRRPRHRRAAARGERPADRAGRHPPCSATRGGADAAPARAAARVGAAGRLRRPAVGARHHALRHGRRARRPAAAVAAGARGAALPLRRHADRRAELPPRRGRQRR